MGALEVFGTIGEGSILPEPRHLRRCELTWLLWTHEPEPAETPDLTLPSRSERRQPWASRAE